MSQKVIYFFRYGGQGGFFKCPFAGNLDINGSISYVICHKKKSSADLANHLSLRSRKTSIYFPENKLKMRRSDLTIFSPVFVLHRTHNAFPHTSLTQLCKKRGREVRRNAHQTPILLPYIFSPEKGKRMHVTE